MHLPTSRAARLTGALATVLLVGGLTAAPAFAHVEAAGAPAAGGATTVTFSFTHGCKGSPTTSLRVQLPAGTSAVTAENPAGWTSKASDTEIDWSGGTVPDSQPGSFITTMTLTGAAGDTVFFPTIQGCAQGENTWIDKSTDPEAEQAAPRIVLGAAAETPATGDHDHDNAGAGETGGTEPATGTTEAADHDKAGGETGSSVAAVATSVPAPSTTAETVVPATTSTSSSSLPIILGIVAAVLVVGGIIGLVLRSRTPAGTDATGDATGSGPTESGPTGSGQSPST